MFFLRIMTNPFQEINNLTKNPGRIHLPGTHIKEQGGLAYAGISSTAISGSSSETQSEISLPSSFSSSFVNLNTNR